MPNALMPKTVLLASQWLRAQAAVTDICANQISYRLEGVYPAIRLTDMGPMENGPEEALKRIQVECWADTYDKAEDLALAVVSVVPESAGSWPAGYCAGGSVEAGPFSSPDPNSQRFRHQLDVALWLYPTP